MESEIVSFPVFYEETSRLGFQLQEGETSFAYRMALEAARLGNVYTYPLASQGSSPVKCELDCTLYSAKGITGFEATVYILPDYKGTAIEKIALDQLEEQLRACSWRLEDQNRKYLPEIYGSLLALEQSGSKGKAAAEILMLKYWLDTPVEKYINLSPVKLKYRRKEYFPVRGDHSDFTIQEAEALLSGRPVFKGLEPAATDGIDGEWTQLTFYLGQGSLQKERHTYAGYDIASRILELPFIQAPSENELTVIVQNLLHGNSTVAHLEVEGKARDILLTADPKKMGILLTDFEGRELNVASLLSDRIRRLQEKLKDANGQASKQGKRKGPAL